MRRIAVVLLMIGSLFASHASVAMAQANNESAPLPPQAHEGSGSLANAAGSNETGIIPKTTPSQPKLNFPKTSSAPSGVKFGLDVFIYDTFKGENSPLSEALDKSAVKSPILIQSYFLFYELNQIANDQLKFAANQNQEWIDERISELHQYSEQGGDARTAIPGKNKKQLGLVGILKLVKSSEKESARWTRFYERIQEKVSEIFKSQSFDEHSLDHRVQLYHELASGIFALYERERLQNDLIGKIKSSDGGLLNGGNYTVPGTSNSDCCRKRKRCVLELLF